jgi:hypothetical protein
MSHKFTTLQSTEFKGTVGKRALLSVKLNHEQHELVSAMWGSKFNI